MPNLRPLMSPSMRLSMSARPTRTRRSPAGVRKASERARTSSQRCVSGIERMLRPIRLCSGLDHSHHSKDGSRSALGHQARGSRASKAGRILAWCLRDGEAGSDQVEGKRPTALTEMRLAMFDTALTRSLKLG